MTRSPRERFDQMSERARAAAGARPERDDPARPVAPGDLFAFPETAEHGVEWVLLERWDVPPRALLVAADTRPQVGTGDVEVPAGEPAAPLVLRCRFDARVAPERLTPERRTGRVSEAVVAEAREARRAADRGTLAGSPLERETDADPEHQAWLDDVVRPARAALEAAVIRQDEAPPPGERPDRTWPSARALYALAASLLVAVLGLSLYSVGLLEELERERLPRVAIEAPEPVDFGTTSRGPLDIPIPPPRPDEELSLRVSFAPDLVDGYSTFSLAIVSGDKETRMEVDPGERLTLGIPGSFIRDRHVRLRLYGQMPSGPEELLDEVPVTFSGH